MPEMPRRPRLLVHEVVHLLGREVLVLHDEGHDGRVDGSATGSHHEAVQGCESHGGIHRHAMVDGAHRAPVAQMARDELQILYGLVQKRRCALGDVAMGGAMGAVLADRVLLVQLVGQRVHVGLRRQRLEERRVEDGHHGHAGHMLLTGTDSHERRLVVQGRELCQLVDLGDDVVVDEHRPVEVLAALHDAVPHGVDLVERVDGAVGTARHRLQHQRHRFVVVGHLRVDDRFVVVKPVLVERLGRAHPLADALGEQLLALDVEQLVLQGRGAGVDDENVQGIPPALIGIKRIPTS